MKKLNYKMASLLLANMVINLYGMDTNLKPILCDKDLNLVVRDFNYQTDHVAVQALFTKLYGKTPPSMTYVDPHAQPQAKQNTKDESAYSKDPIKKIAVLIQLFKDEDQDLLHGFIFDKSTFTRLSGLRGIRETTIKYLGVDPNPTTSDKIDKCKEYLFRYMIRHHGEGDFLSTFPSSVQDQAFFKKEGFLKVEGLHLFYKKGSMVRLNTNLAMKLFNNPHFDPTEMQKVVRDPSQSEQAQNAAIETFNRVIYTTTPFAQFMQENMD